jgi:3-oxoacyl-[acyl-carrier-protein] synthase-1
MVAVTDRDRRVIKTMVESRATGLNAVVVTGTGMTTPVGAQAVQTITSIRAGIARMAEFATVEAPVRDPSQYFPEPLIAAQAPGLEEDLPLVQRLLAMATPALAWALDDAAGSDRSSLGRVYLLVFGGEAPATRRGTRIAESFAHRLANRVEGMQPSRIMYSDTGATGFVRGLAAAAEALMSHRCDTVVMGAVDSLLSPETLAFFGDQFRLKTDENPVGLTPGEAAAFLVLELEAHARQRRATAYARLGGVSATLEPHPIHSEEVCTGIGLASCLQDVLAQMEAASIAPAAIYCNLNGESHAAAEWGYAVNRIVAAGRALPDALVHPADCMGDAGAAMGGVLTCLAADSLRRAKRGWAPAIIWCGSDAGPRAAAYLGPV